MNWVLKNNGVLLSYLQKVEVDGFGFYDAICEKQNEALKFKSQNAAEKVCKALNSFLDSLPGNKEYRNKYRIVRLIGNKKPKLIFSNGIRCYSTFGLDWFITEK